MVEDLSTVLYKIVDCVFKDVFPVMHSLVNSCTSNLLAPATFWSRSEERMTKNMMCRLRQT